MDQTLLVVCILAVAGIVSAAITWLLLKALKLLFKIVVFFIIFGAVAYLLMSMFAG